MAKFYADENFPLPVVEERRRLGHDVLTVTEAGRAEQRIPDREVLKFAHHAGRALLTLNRRHFVRLHQEVPGHSGIVACTMDVDFTGQAARIHHAVQSEPLRGRLIRVNRPRP